MASIGYLGLGTMGAGMVKNLVEAGHEVTVWNRTASRADVAGRGAAGRLRRGGGQRS